MPIIALSRRLYPTAPRRRQIAAGGELGDNQQDTTESEGAQLEQAPSQPSNQQTPEQQLDALIANLDDEELASLEELPTEDLEAYLDELRREAGLPRRPRNLLHIAV